MINHVRTLLMNQAGPRVPQAGIPFDVSIPTYTEVVLPPALERVHRALFGNSPDYAARAYWVHQYMALLHQSDFEAYVYDLDLRVTYNTEFGREHLLPFRTTVTPDDEKVFLVGKLDKQTDRMFYSWTFEILPGDRVEIRSGTSVEAYALIYEQGMTRPIPLRDTHFTVLFSEKANNVGDRWTVEHWVRPPGNIVTRVNAACKTLVIDDFLGTNRTGVLRTAAQALRSDDFVERAVGLLLGLVYRTEGIRCREDT